MNNTLFIYLLTRLSLIQGLFLSLAILSTIIIFIGWLWNTIDLSSSYLDEEDIVRLKQQRKQFTSKIWVPTLFTVLTILTPDTKEAMLIIAGGKTMDYVQSDTSLQKIPYKATELILKKMEDYIDETTCDSTKTK
jgi:hypothetical protein